MILLLTQQNENESSYAPKVTKDEAKIDWTKSAKK